ncbi:SAM-dependent methyltransferase [Kocuria rosea]|uniref:Eco57I restriction-modification methylase domain-containing protein n=1 Tax=Kocuria rosea TaxID=1275 RepID=UPI000D64163D|nr:DNA methyltransferase [Kocuria rosea]PWF84031.1 SAM-dependent methyltransferase [Kocuria rosea]QCY34398.1 SAM-dependent DNA methyltransferase [Kocuria rosea]TQN38655.1 N-6 DNA methylase [Kocuria rosea]
MLRRIDRRPRDGAESHRYWLQLVDTDGPFLSVPALKSVWGYGMPSMDSDVLAVLKQAKPLFERAWERWDAHRDDISVLNTYRQAQQTWVETVLRDVLGWGNSYVTDLALPAVADAASGVRSPNHAVTVLPSGALVHGENVGALVLEVDPVDSLRAALDDGWAASPIDRMEELLRHSGVRIGVVTDGRWWAIVSARESTMVASGVVDSQTWIEEPATRNAFVELLQRKRLLGGKPSERLTELFGASVAAAEEITDALGVQVRKAVELLVQAFSEAGLEAKRRGDPDPLPENRGEVYEAAVTVMMRVVFLLFAEERGLLPQGRLFAMGYGISDQLDLLDQRARDEGAESLDATHLTWHRLLATSQALYRGASFEDMRLPSYGGSLFDAARMPFLTARTERGTLAVTVSDRVMLEILRSVQVTELKGEPARRISFRDIDVEQIGYIYEGLLGYSSREVDRVVVGLLGTDGVEPEIPLNVLEDLSDGELDDTVIAKAILKWVKDNQPAAKAPTQSRLAKALASGDNQEDAVRALLTVTGADEELRTRLRSWIGIIRRDLRGRPVVIAPGGLAVVETPSRSTSGAHYTPRSLAEEVVEHALEPLVYSPGPHQTAERNQWKPVSSDKILDLKVADIACGSGAFLVAAARYLGKRLVEAWHREGVARGSAQSLETHAVRQIVASCLYGADINEMAVEMCKLSLWLVSLDPKLPFSFVDDKVLHGNSLLGLTDAKQLERLHIDPKAASQNVSFYDLDVSGILVDAASLRRRLATEIDDSDPQRSAATKRRQWREYQNLTAKLTRIADGVVAAGLKVGGKPGRALNETYENLRIAVERAYPAIGELANSSMLNTIIASGLTPTVTTDYERWKPLHWILSVPDVMASGGFDAIIGNPPFLGGQKLTGSMGTNIRDWLVNVLAEGKKGSADFVAYFFLRAMSLLRGGGTLGLIATNSIAQGITREVGLDRMVADGFTINRSIQSRAWPARSANLEFAAVWGIFGELSRQAHRVADGLAVNDISTKLEPASKVCGAPYRLAENSLFAFQGCIVLGKGFVLGEKEALAWIEEDSQNADVLFPYLNGDDISARPDASASRWVIDFYDRSELEAAKYALPYQRLVEKVKGERQEVNRRALRERWWQYAEKRPGMRKAISALGEVLVIARVSKSVMPIRVPAAQILSDSLTVFATDSYQDQAVISSSPHQIWAIAYGSTLETRVRYAASDVFETFPRPVLSDRVEKAGKNLDAERRKIMLTRHLGLTNLYNMVNNPAITSHSDADVARVRELHVEIDKSVMAAYGWGDVHLDHGFHIYRQTQRWTVSPAARVEILDRLLEENHRRAAVRSNVPSPVREVLEE